LSGPEARETVGGLTARATQRLTAAGTAEPRREALRLMADLLERTPGDLLLRAEESVDPARVHAIATALERRAAGEPMPYVTGIAGFRQLTLRVDRRVLIPRPETEGLVELVLRLAPRGRVIDVGTGSGCIAISLAGEGEYEQVLAVDRSAEALTVARHNAAHCGVEVRFFRGDLLAAVGAGRVDVVISNPPYLTDAECTALDSSVAAWEPDLALRSGPEGFDAIGRLLVESHQAVPPGGLLAMEIDSSRAAETVALADRAGWREIAITQDLFGRDRYLAARREASP
jgi:release factor glutamine methyltransferase